MLRPEYGARVVLELVDGGVVGPAHYPADEPRAQFELDEARLLCDPSRSGLVYRYGGVVGNYAVCIGCAAAKQGA
jgi:hypothetical protein